MFLLVASVCLSAPVPVVQFGDPEYILTTIGIPCDTSIEGPRVAPGCPPYSEQGWLLYVRSGDPIVVAFVASLKFRDHHGDVKTVTATIERDFTRDSSGKPNYAIHPFRVGRAKVPWLPAGNELLGIRVLSRGP